MTTFCLLSSSSMTVVFLESGHSNNPVLKLISFDDFVCGCLVPLLQSDFWVVSYPHAQMRMADRGGTVPHWLGTTQLEAGDPWRLSVC